MDQMPIELRSPLRRFFFAGTCFVLVGLYLRWALGAYLASHLAATPDLSNLNKATRLEPSNAEYRELLAETWNCPAQVWTRLFQIIGQPYI